MPGRRSHGDLWVDDFNDGSLTRLHDATGVVRTFRAVGGNPGFSIVDGDVVWTADWTEARVVRLDAVGRPHLHSVFLPVTNALAGVWTVAAGANAIWATTARDGTLWRIDPKTNAVKRINVPFSPTGVTADANDVWLTVRANLGRWAVVEDRFDVVAVRVEHERAVVAGVVVRPFARSAVVAEAGLDSRAMEGVHRRPVGSRERHVHVLRDGLVLDESANRRVSPLTKNRAASPSSTRRPTTGATVSVEEPRLGQVADADQRWPTWFLAAGLPADVDGLEAVSARVTHEGAVAVGPEYSGLGPEARRRRDSRLPSSRPHHASTCSRDSATSARWRLRVGGRSSRAPVDRQVVPTRTNRGPLYGSP